MQLHSAGTCLWDYISDVRLAIFEVEDVVCSDDAVPLKPSSEVIDILLPILAEHELCKVDRVFNASEPICAARGRLEGKL